MVQTPRTALLPLLLIWCASALEAQAARVSGRVVDRASGAPVNHAELVILGVDLIAYSDSLGHYEFARVAPGVVQVSVRAVGFTPLTIFIELAPGQRAERHIILDRNVAELPGVDVTAPASTMDYRLTAFERRRMSGRGQYLTEDQIVRIAAYSIADAVKNMRGVIYQCGGGSCYVRMSRAPMRCLPEYIVDDRVMNDMGPGIPIRDVVGIEVYTGPSEVPGEYAGRNAGCGVIVIWTRSGPPRKSKDPSN